MLYKNILLVASATFLGFSWALPTDPSSSDLESKYAKLRAENPFPAKEPYIHVDTGETPDSTLQARGFIEKLRALLGVLREPQNTARDTSSASCNNEAECQTNNAIFSIGLNEFIEDHRNKGLNSPPLTYESDGCSVPPEVAKAFKIDKDFPYGYEFLHSCYRHDFGYRNYKAQNRFTSPNRELLDNKFQEDLLDQCKSQFPKADIFHPGQLVNRKWCNIVAKVYYKFPKLLAGDGQLGSGACRDLDLASFDKQNQSSLQQEGLYAKAPGILKLAIKPRSSFSNKTTPQFLPLKQTYFFKRSYQSEITPIYQKITSTMPGQPDHPLSERFAAADVYEKLTGGWPARVAKNLVANLPTPITPESVVLDNCCGSGAVTTAIINSTHAKGFIPKVNATDLSPGMVEHVTKIFNDFPEIETKIMDAQKLDFDENTFSHIVCAFGVFFCPDYEAGYREMYRVAAPGSVTVITSWKVVGWIPLVNYIIKKVRPDQEEFKFPAPPGFKENEWVKERMVNAGWKDVEVREVEDYTSITSETEGVLMSFVKDALADWTDEEKARWGPLFAEAAKFYGIPETAEGTWKARMVALVASGRK
ncbi:hypothetical protein TWF718_001134 [Orbilia javanica]|uniref:Methyltransferase domain-containing protein n=1 Tax=Orbilia javanica TaxID=47235 RepID=A0AAN8N0U7_9PEZI